MPDFATIKDGLIVVALVAVLGGKLLRWRDGRKAGTNGRSGDKSSAYWELTLSRVVKAELDAYNQRVREPEALEAANERRQIHAKLNQLAASFELSIQEKKQQLTEAIADLKQHLRDDKEN